jgi:hypothetical protein
MLRRRYEILLPLQFNDGRPIPDELFYQTREELVERFEGLRWVGQPDRGVWKPEGSLYEDQTYLIKIDVDDTPEVRQFFLDYKPTLLHR